MASITPPSGSYPTRPSTFGPSPVRKMTGGPMYVVPGASIGMVSPGNIDLLNRPKVPNWNTAEVDSAVYPAYSTVDSATRTDARTGKAVLFPRVVGGKILDEDSAWNHYTKTGEHLGIFNSPAHANLYATLLHLQQQKAMK